MPQWSKEPVPPSLPSLDLDSTVPLSMAKAKAGDIPSRPQENYRRPRRDGSEVQRRAEEAMHRTAATPLLPTKAERTRSRRAETLSEAKVFFNKARHRFHSSGTAALHHSRVADAARQADSGMSPPMSHHLDGKSAYQEERQPVLTRLERPIRRMRREGVTPMMQAAGEGLRPRVDSGPSTTNSATPDPAGAAGDTAARHVTPPAPEGQ